MRRQPLKRSFLLMSKGRTHYSANKPTKNNTRTELIAEQKRTQARLERGDTSVLERLQEIDEELIAIGAESAEGRARRILSGLGFTKKMQVKTIFLTNKGQ